MADILIRLKDNDPTGTNPGAYRPGMPVLVLPDNHPPFGSEERPPNFFVVKLPGIDPERVRKYIEEYITVSPILGPDGEPIIERGPYRKRWRIILENLPAAIREKAMTQGVITVGPGGDITWRNLRQRLLNLETGVFETEDL